MMQKRTKPDAMHGSQPVKKDKIKKKYEEANFVDTTKPVWNYSLLTDEDVANYQNGTNYQLYKNSVHIPYR